MNLRVADDPVGSRATARIRLGREPAEASDQARIENRGGRNSGTAAAETATDSLGNDLAPPKVGDAAQASERRTANEGAEAHRSAQAAPTTHGPPSDLAGPSQSMQHGDFAADAAISAAIGPLDRKPIVKSERTSSAVVSFRTMCEKVVVAPGTVNPTRAANGHQVVSDVGSQACDNLVRAPAGGIWQYSPF